jgi:hypothetical protein
VTVQAGLESRRYILQFATINRDITTSIDEVRQWIISRINAGQKHDLCAQIRLSQPIQQIGNQRAPPKRRKHLARKSRRTHSPLNENVDVRH